MVVIQRPRNISSTTVVIYPQSFDSTISTMDNRPNVNDIETSTNIETSLFKAALPTATANSMLFQNSTTSAPDSNGPNSNDSQSGLSGMAIGGIVAGVLSFIVLVFGGWKVKKTYEKYAEETRTRLPRR